MPRTRVVLALAVVMLAVAVATAAVVLAASPFDPAHLRRGSVVPGIPATMGGAEVVGGGEVWLELGVSASGGVEDVVTLRETPPFTDALRASVSGWSFRPAQESGAPVSSRVLAVGQFRPPTLVGPAIGQPPRDVATASAEVAVPTQSPMPAYPMNAIGDAAVLVEATVGADGHVTLTRLVSGAEPFGGAAVAAVQGWQFKPATRQGMPVPAVVCVAVAFRAPIGGPSPVAPKPKA